MHPYNLRCVLRFLQHPHCLTRVPPTEVMGPRPGVGHHGFVIEEGGGVTVGYDGAVSHDDGARCRSGWASIFMNSCFPFGLYPNYHFGLSLT